MANPPNLSQSPAGYNDKMFRSVRSIRRGLSMLGYPASSCDQEISGDMIRKFQNDYNRCSKKFGHWGTIEASSEMDVPTLNGLEHAIRWAKKIEKTKGLPTASAWRFFCNLYMAPGERTYSATGETLENGPTVAAQPEVAESNFVEVLPNGNGKLRNIYNDDALRANIVDFEKHGSTVFAVVILPPQDGLPGGRMDPFACPCLIRR